MQYWPGGHHFGLEDPILAAEPPLSAEPPAATELLLAAEPLLAAELSAARDPLFSTGFSVCIEI